MPIYTKKGDKGETGLYSSNPEKKVRVSKDSLIVDAIGGIDELNSNIGVAKGLSENPEVIRILSEVQRDLLAIGSILAGSGLSFSTSKTKKLERVIDEMDKILPKLSNFILPGGTREAAQLHVCRSVARRAERGVVGLNEVKKVRASILKYINRLSDFFFMMARKSNFDSQVKDEIWVGEKRKVKT
jgi:cob(I)alamin adenosyltransferase